MAFQQADVTIVSLTSSEISAVERSSGVDLASLVPDKQTIPLIRGRSCFCQIELDNGAGRYKSDGFQIRTLDGSKKYNC